MGYYASSEAAMSLDAWFWATLAAMVLWLAICLGIAVWG